MPLEYYQWQLIGTAALLVTVWILRVVIGRIVRGNTQRSEDLRRAVLVRLRTLTLVMTIGGMIALWSPQIHSVLLSAVAVAAAIVLATKELLMCVSGTLLGGSSRSFRIGDRVEIDGSRGDVYDQTLFTTTLMEVGPGSASAQHTGRLVVIPNSIFLSKAVINETFSKAFILHAFLIPVRLKDDWERVETALLQAANEVCAPFLEDARVHLERVARERNLAAVSVEPRVTVTVPEPGKLNLVVRIPVPVRRRVRVEQDILRLALPEMRRAMKV